MNFHYIYNYVQIKIVRIAYTHPAYEGPSWLWSYGSWIYNYLCNHYQCLSPLIHGVSYANAEQHHLKEVKGGYLFFWNRSNDFQYWRKTKLHAHSTFNCLYFYIISISWLCRIVLHSCFLRQKSCMFLYNDTFITSLFLHIISPVWSSTQTKQSMNVLKNGIVETAIFHCFKWDYRWTNRQRFDSVVRFHTQTAQDRMHLLSEHLNGTPQYSAG